MCCTIARQKYYTTTIATRCTLSDGYVELLNCALSILLGHPIPIESETTDKAIDFLIERNEIDIEQSYHNEYEKEKVKAEMKATLNTLRNVIKDYLSSKRLLK